MLSHPKKVFCVLKHGSPSAINLELVTPLGEVARERVRERLDVRERHKVVPQTMPVFIKDNRNDISQTKTFDTTWHKMTSPDKRSLEIGAVVKVALRLDCETLNKVPWNKTYLTNIIHIDDDYSNTKQPMACRALLTRSGSVLACRGLVVLVDEVGMATSWRPVPWLYLRLIIQVDLVKIITFRSPGRCRWPPGGATPPATWRSNHQDLKSKSHLKA